VETRPVGEILIATNVIILYIRKTAKARHQTASATR